MKNQHGFTLVELAIVLMIIGLLIGGILKGQELIQNARINTAMRQLKSFQAAHITFRDNYTYMPGDVISPSTRLPNCTTAPCSTTGNGDNLFSNLAEMTNYWVHMSAANLITNVNMAATTPLESSPPGALGGIFLLGTSGSAINLSLGSLASDAFLTQQQAEIIDRKMDDGHPKRGDIISYSSGSTCDTSYDASISGPPCMVQFSYEKF